MPAGLMSRSSADKIWQLLNFKQMQKARQKSVTTQFVLWLCQKEFWFCLLVQITQIGSNEEIFS